eukprot:COSAG02_NODE_2350_length_9082_cov_4.100857_2_plen_62_part_00
MRIAHRSVASALGGEGVPVEDEEWQRSWPQLVVGYDLLSLAHVNVTPYLHTMGMLANMPIV